MTTDERPLPVTGWTCTECARLSWPGYCAPLRCYCGHPACTAHASWNPLRQPKPKQLDEKAR